MGNRAKAKRPERVYSFRSSAALIFGQKKARQRKAGNGEICCSFVQDSLTVSKKNRKTIILLWAEDFSTKELRRQYKTRQRYLFPCRNSPTLNYAVPSSRFKNKKICHNPKSCTDLLKKGQKKSRHRTTLPHSTVQYHRR